jgi:5-methylcytosine-specific restriction protein A
MPTRPCLGVPGQPCGVLVTGPANKAGTRCPKCRRLMQRAKRQQRPHTYSEDQRRAHVVAEWRAAYGDWCPGWQRMAHHTTDLTADHLVAVAAGGSETGLLQVLCRACNGAKQANN